MVLEQDAVLACLMLALDLTLGVRMHGSATGVMHAPAREPISQFARDVAEAVVGAAVARAGRNSACVLAWRLGHLNRKNVIMHHTHVIDSV